MARQEVKVDKVFSSFATAYMWGRHGGGIGQPWVLVHSSYIHVEVLGQLMEAGSFLAPCVS